MGLLSGLFGRSNEPARSDSTRRDTAAGSKYQGVIGALGLNDFWNDCTRDEQAALMRYERSGLGSDPKASPIRGSAGVKVAGGALGYYMTCIEWAVSEKNYAFADKLIRWAEGAYSKSRNQIFKHFYLQTVAECYYKQRDTRADAIDMAIDYCERDVKLYPKYAPCFVKENGCVPHIQTFKRLAIIYEKHGEYDKAIEVCKRALEYGLTDTTKGGYAGRLETLQKKQGHKNSPA